MSKEPVILPAAGAEVMRLTKVNARKWESISSVTHVAAPRESAADSCPEECGALTRRRYSAWRVHTSCEKPGFGEAIKRSGELEAALIGQAPDTEFLRQACESCRSLDALDDVHAPASYRQHLATVMSRRALEKAYARATGKA